MKYEFSCFGNQNIQGMHKTTFEIVIDHNLSLNGDCIIGTKSNFDPEKIKPFLKSKKLSLILKVEKLTEIILFVPNSEFFDSSELVIRLGKFISKRTLGIDADKAAIHINLRMIELMKNPLQEMKVILQFQ